MIEFLEPTFGLRLWSTLLYLFIVLIYWRQINRITNNSKDKILTPIFFLLILYAVTAFNNGDFYHYIPWVKFADVNWNIDPTNNVEIAYQYISSAIDGNYTLFRLIVWGGAATLIALTARRLNINPSLTLFLVLALFGHYFSYARATLAMSVYFYGLSFFIIRDYGIKKIINFIIGIALILFSIFFHRSMYILVALTPLLLFPKLYSGNKRILLYSILGIGIFLFILLLGSSVLVQFGLDFFAEDEAMLNKIATYSDREISELGFSGILRKILENAFKCIMMIIILASFSKKKTDDLLIPDQLSKFAFALYLIGFAMMFLGQAFYTMSYRIPIMAFIPYSLIIAYGYQYKILTNRNFKIICFLGILFESYSAFYSLYLTL